MRGRKLLIKRVGDFLGHVDLLGGFFGTIHRLILPLLFFHGENLVATDKDRLQISDTLFEGVLHLVGLPLGGHLEDGAGLEGGLRAGARGGRETCLLRRCQVAVSFCVKTFH